MFNSQLIIQTKDKVAGMQLAERVLTIISDLIISDLVGVINAT